MSSFSILLGRQPILDRDQHLVGHHLLLRQALSPATNPGNQLSTLASTLQHVAERSMEKMVGHTLSLVDVDTSVLLSDFVLFLPNKNMVLMLAADTAVSAPILDRMLELRQAGFRFCLETRPDEIGERLALLPLVDILRVDIRILDQAGMTQFLTELKTTRKKLLVTGVADVTQFERSLHAGFDYYDGQFFTVPVIKPDKKISPAEILIMQILALINSDADNAEIESAIKKDAFIALNLLNMVNSSAAGMSQRIGSLKQALQIIGRTQLQCWLQILLYKKPGNTAVVSPLLLMASMRGKMLELMARKLKPNNRNAADLAFMVGIMSLMDALFGLPMEEILAKITVFNEVSHALVGRQGFYGDLLKIVEYSEKIDSSAPLLIPALRQMPLSLEDFYDLQLDAFEWVDQIVHSGN
ncbi:MAG: HDOD domain-containing protein [Pseudomonadota bacterium]